MDRGVKRAVERIFRDQIWIEKAAPTKDVAELIANLRPATPQSPLRRIGPAGDGGYLLPDDLDGIAACISPGVALECGFDEAMASRGMDVLMADASVEGPPIQNPRFRFVPKFLDNVASDTTMTLEELAALAGPANGDLVLQMDIEGAEYRVLSATPDALLRRFRIMVVEFHYLDRLFSRHGFEEYERAFRRLTETHNVVHIHPNNCTRATKRGGLIVPPVMEFTFYRKDRPLDASASRAVYPHTLDADCAPNRPPMVLPVCWQRTQL